MKNVRGGSSPSKLFEERRNSKISMIERSINTNQKHLSEAKKRRSIPTHHKFKKSESIYTFFLFENGKSEIDKRSPQGKRFDDKSRPSGFLFLCHPETRKYVRF